MLFGRSSVGVRWDTLPIPEYTNVIGRRGKGVNLILTTRGSSASADAAGIRAILEPVIHAGETYTIRPASPTAAAVGILSRNKQ